MTDRVFVGRDVELASIAEEIRSAEAGRSSVVCIEGAAGSGKSALARRVLDALPPGVAVLRAAGEEVAREIPNALVDQFAVEADRTVFGTGLRLLERFARLRDTGPAVVLIEDLHWADSSSRGALLTAARRLDADGVVLVITTRPDSTGDDGWDAFVREGPVSLRISLTPLTAEEIGELGRRMGLAMTPASAQRVRGHTLGHALYVRTLLEELGPVTLDDTDLPLPVPRSLAATTVGRVGRLPERSQAVASALAVLNRPSSLVDLGRLADVDAPVEALEPLLGTGMVTPRSTERLTVEFAHPLFRQAVYEALTPSERQSLHRRAITLVDSTTALAHRAAAAAGVDEELATDLEAAGEAEAAAGWPAPAARSLLWAADLSGDDDGRQRRLVRGAQLLLADGQTARAAALRPKIRDAAPSGRRSLVLGVLAWQQGDADAAERELTAAAADEHADADVRGAAFALLGIVASFMNRGRDAYEAGVAVVALGVTDRTVELDGWTALVVGDGLLHGSASAHEHLRARIPDVATAVAADDIDLLVIRGMLGYYGCHVAQPEVDLRAAIAMAGGTAGTRAHMHLAQVLYRTGRWDEAITHARVAMSLATEQRHVWMQAQILATLGHVLGSQGEWTAAEQHIGRAEQLAAVVRTAEAVMTTEVAAAALAFARYQPRSVIAHLAPLSDAEAAGETSALALIDWWPMLVITRLNEGDAAGARREQDRLVAAAARRGLDLTSTIAGVEARIAAFEGRSADAVSAFERALAATGEDTAALDRALLHQSLGETLQAAGDRRQAVVHLRRAHDMLAEVGATPFRERADATLDACGLRPRKSRQQRRVELTEREQNVASLVATGMTNKEVAANLYVSAKAVEYHLGNIFAKLGLTSRRELRQSANSLVSARP